MIRVVPMKRPSLSQVIEETATNELAGYTRARDLEDDIKCLYFENVESHRMVRFELGRPKAHVWMMAFSYSTRPTPRELNNRGLPNPNLRSLNIGPLPMLTPSDEERFVRWVRHYAQHASLIAFDDPFNARFLDAFSLSKDDTALAVETARNLLAARILSLRGDVPKAEVGFPFGTVFVKQEAGFVSPRGSVPPFARLAIDESRRASPSAWLEVNTTTFVPGFYMSDRARDETLRALMEDASRSVKWSLVSDGERRVDLARVATGFALEVSKGYVVHLNRDRPTFLRLIESLADDDWKDLYEKKSVAPNAAETLLARLSEAPGDFSSYKALAEYYAGRNDAARSNLFLGLGYLRVHKLTAVARGKLELARATDSKCEGLVEAFDELAAANSTNSK